MKYLILSICVFGCLTTEGFSEEIISGCYTLHSYREEFRFETHSWNKTLEKFKESESFDWEFWKEMEKDSFFGQILMCFYWRCPKEREDTPPHFVVTPLVWALTLDDMHIKQPINKIGRGIDKPDVLEMLVCHVKNEKTNVSYFLCVRRTDVCGVYSEWRNADRRYDDQMGFRRIHRAPYKLQNSQDFQTQLLEYLESLDFGPNEWDTTRRCASLRLYGLDSEKEPFQYPLITKEEKEKRYEILEDEMSIID